MTPDSLDPYGAAIDAIQKAIKEQPDNQGLVFEARQLLEHRARFEQARAEARLVRLQADALERQQPPPPPPRMPWRHLGAKQRVMRSWEWILQVWALLRKGPFKSSATFLILVGVCALIYYGVQASEANGYVVASFSVPADVASGGLTGDVAARRFLDHMLFIHLHDNTLLSSGLKRANFRHTSQKTFQIVEPGIPIKIDIPSTSFSLGDVYNFLFKRLSNETVISADLYEEKPAAGTAAPVYRLTAHPGNGAAACSSAGTNFEILFSEAAGCVYRALELYRYAAFLAYQGNYNDAKSIYIKVAREGSDHDREIAFEALDYLAKNWGIARVFDDSPGPSAANNSARYLKAVQFLRGAVNPQGGPGGSADFPFAYKDLIVAEETLGYDEDAFQHTQALLGLIANPPSSDYARWPAARLKDEFSARRASAQGDFAATLGLAGASATLVSEALAATHDKAALNGLAGLDGVHVLKVFERLHRWSDVVSHRDAALSDCQKSDCLAERQVLPLLAEANAMLAAGDKGRLATADALIGQAPLDCYLCARIHGTIDAAKRNWGGAEYWFDYALHLARSLPFADADLGAMLMHRGKFDGAIAHFALANQKGPHFADPLEMWGEVLIFQNHSDLADAKFEEAARYAPNWGRLHLKWGEALLWSGKRDDAAKQFDIAAALDLSVAERAELQRMMSPHV
ncbi:MAG TPA: hypothetical protein VII56_09235 [Rhizomicrobium sp.]